MPPPAPQAESLFVSAPDGLRLHVRGHGGRHAAGSPVVCLPGLSRNTSDFDVLADALAGAGRRVLALDYRGRGRSDYDPDPANYNLAVELGDVIAVLTALEAAPAIFVGTSRGGLIAMLLAAARPTLIAGVVFNDIGPAIEPQGLLRIKSYVGRMPRVRSYEEGAETLRRLFSAQFTRLGPDDWLAWSRRNFEERDGRLVQRYDSRLAETLKDVDVERPLPAMWPQFDALAHAPVMVVRGENSDILSAATVAAMATRRPDLVRVQVAGEGHAPLLDDAPTIAAISRFVAACEQRAAAP
ncbi:MAG: alpha/beta hydrolase [Pseudorhodoplanes sp.]|nr:alpha/beta hydrolase [Pseudorhodoplanes sp.]